MLKSSRQLNGWPLNNFPICFYWNIVPCAALLRTLFMHTRCLDHVSICWVYLNGYFLHRHCSVCILLREVTAFLPEKTMFRPGFYVLTLTDNSEFVTEQLSVVNFLPTASMILFSVADFSCAHLIFTLSDGLTMMMFVLQCPRFYMQYLAFSTY